MRKWQLACEGTIAHVVVMPNVGLDTLEEFVRDYVSEGRGGAFLIHVSGRTCTLSFFLLSDSGPQGLPRG